MEPKLTVQFYSSAGMYSLGANALVRRISCAACHVQFSRRTFHFSGEFLCINESPSWHASSRLPRAARCQVVRLAPPVMGAVADHRVAPAPARIPTVAHRGHPACPVLQAQPCLTVQAARVPWVVVATAQLARAGRAPLASLPELQVGRCLVPTLPTAASCHRVTPAVNNQICLRPTLCA